jgi:hypothetical protein
MARPSGPKLSPLVKEVVLVSHIFLWANSQRVADRVSSRARQVAKVAQLAGLFAAVERLCRDHRRASMMPIRNASARDWMGASRVASLRR